MNIAVFFNEPSKLDYPLSKQSYLQAYSELSHEIEMLGDTFFVTRGQDSYIGDKIFKQCWKFKKNELVDIEVVQIDAVYNKGDFPFDGKMPVLNVKEINNVCTDKWQMYKRFQEWCPRTWLVTNMTEYQDAFSHVKTEKIVIKPVDGEEGREVYIDQKRNLELHQPVYPVLIQEFLDSSIGIPGIVEGLHDFRIAILNGEIVYSYYRTPPEGSYLANVSRGGRFEVIKAGRIPSIVLEIVKKIDQHFNQYPQRFYGIDFAFTPEGPRIIEMNSKLGLLPNNDDPVFIEVKKKIAHALHEISYT